MKQLFIHNAFFRLIAPVLIGMIVYLLILSINNNVWQLQEQYFSEELYLCIGISYLTQEWNRLSILLLKSYTFPSLVIEMVMRLLGSLSITLILVWVTVHYYFKIRLGYAANMEEIVVFLSIYGVISIIYLVLYFGHYTLYRINTSLLEEETEIKEDLHLEFQSYTRDINPKLLFEGLENTIVSLRKNQIDLADDIIDHLSFLYRYILGRRDKELIRFDSEIEAVKHLVNLNNLFPYKHIKLHFESENELMVIPSSIISLVDHFIRCCIPARNHSSTLSIKENQNHLEVKLEYISKIDENTDEIINYWKTRYKIFTDSEWEYEKDEFHTLLKIPALNYTNIESPITIS